MNRNRRPFWLPASNYYVLAVAVTAAFFFLVYGILHEIPVDLPWAVAGVSSSILLAGAVILRETVLRREYNRFLREQREIGLRVSAVNARMSDYRHSKKLTLEQNAAILGEIKKKSDAAKVLSKLSDGHREVFELCSEYISRNERELTTVNAGSPRLAPLLKSRSSVADYHRYHLLQWAEIESRSLTSAARSRSNPEEKIGLAQNALGVIETALSSYPAEANLLESRELLQDLIVSIKVSHYVEQAERAAYKGNYAEAKSLYRDALFFLGRDNVQSNAREHAAKQINIEIEKVRELENGQ